jgi:hypothetical protein
LGQGGGAVRVRKRRSKAGRLTGTPDPRIVEADIQAEFRQALRPRVWRRQVVSTIKEADCRGDLGTSVPRSEMKAESFETVHRKNFLLSKLVLCLEVAG